MRLAPTLLTHDELVALLRDVLERVEQNDSFEGFINYLIPEDMEAIRAGKFAVEARYRVGNSEGQGGMVVLGEWVEDDPQSEDDQVAVLALDTSEPEPATWREADVTAEEAARAEGWREIDEWGPDGALDESAL